MTDESKKRQISTKHRDLLAAADVYDILDELPEPQILQVIRWINEKYCPSKEKTPA